MSQEFNQTSRPEAPQEQPPKRNNTWIYIAIIALLLITNIYLFMNKNTVTTQRDEAIAQRDTVSTNMDNLKTDYDAALSRLDLLVGKNSQLDSMVNSRDGEISRLKTQIQNILSNSRSTASDLSKARTLLNSLNRKVKSYEEQIAELKDENGRLTEYSSEVTKERDSTVTTNIALQQKVRLGAVLHASNIRMVPIDLRRNGKKEKETERASRVDILRITFDIDENRIAENGVKDIYLRITGPDGGLLSNAAYGSGVTATSTGETLNYTLAKQFALKQGEPVNNLVIDWNQNSDYKKGAYKIEVYNEGYKIGGGSVTLH